MKMVLKFRDLAHILKSSPSRKQQPIPQHFYRYCLGRITLKLVCLLARASVRAKTFSELRFIESIYSVDARMSSDSTVSLEERNPGVGIGTIDPFSAWG